VVEIDTKRIERAVRDLLEAIGDDPSRDGLLETPKRVAQMYTEITGGTHEEAVEVLGTQFEEDHQEMVIIRDVPFYSICEHHLLPFFGTAHVGYLPRGRVVGISKLARAVDILARRPQVQERLTSQVADAINEALSPEGIAVVIRAEHLCMAMRGVRKPGTSVVTSATRGDFRDSIATRGEFLSLLRGGIS
jgi:GTP cyclohydrolase I